MRVGRLVSAIAATTVAFLCGVWLMVAPWILGYPRPASGWGDQVRTDFWTGVAVVFLSGLGFVWYGLGIRRALQPAAPPTERAGGGAPTPEVSGRGGLPAASPTQLHVPPGADLEDILVPIATALLSDLVQRGEQRGGPSAPSREGGAG